MSLCLVIEHNEIYSNIILYLLFQTPFFLPQCLTVCGDLSINCAVLYIDGNVCSSPVSTSFKITLVGV